MKAQETLVNHRVRGLFAGWGRRLASQPQVPTLRSFVLGLVALVMVIVGMRSVREALWLDMLILVGGGLMLWLWLLHHGSNVRTPLIACSHLILPRWWLGSVLALGAVGISIWGWRTLDVERPTVADWQWYVVSVGLLVLAALVMERWQFRPQRLLPGTNSIILGGIVLLGAIVRLVNLGSLPFGTWYDEAVNGLEALRMLREVDYQPIFVDGVNSVGQYLWLIVGAFELFGETTLAVRSISAMMGIATVLAAYWAGRELHGHSTGIVWAFLFAVARWSITFSRLGMYNSATPLFELLALAWFLRGLRRGSVLDFTLAGIAVGLGMSFYYAFQLFLVAFAIFGLVIAWQERANWRTLWAGVAIGVLAVLLVISPLVKYVMAKPESYFSRVQTTSLFTGKAPEERLPALLSNASKHLLMFNVRGDPNGRHNLPGEPMLDWVSGGLMVIGLATCLRRGVAPRYLIAPVWLAIGLLGGILSLDFEAPQSLRTIGALPAALLCAALPVSLLAREWRSGAGRYFPNGGLWLLGAVLLLPAGALNLHTYFVRQAGDFASWNAHSTPETIAARILREADPGLQKYVISLFDGHPTVRFLAGGVEYHRVETNAMLPLLGEMPEGMLLVVDAERQALYEEARRIYTTGNFEEVRPPFGGPAVVYVAELRSEVLQSVQGLRGTYGRAEDDVAQVRKDLTIDFQWPADALVEVPFVAEWQGVLATNSYGPHQFFVQAPGEVTLRIGESVVLEGDASQP
jgi:4-amino-4-deoxy-L-arabinose transferase-like glycosyltransferase